MTSPHPPTPAKGEEMPPRVWIAMMDLRNIPELTGTEGAGIYFQKDSPVSTEPSNEHDHEFVSIEDHKQVLKEAVEKARREAFEEAADFCESAFTLDNAAISIVLKARAKARPASSPDQGTEGGSGE